MPPPLKPLTPLVIGIHSHTFLPPWSIPIHFIAPPTPPVLPHFLALQPGVPPTTVVGDVIGYYFNIVLVSSCVLMLMVRMAGQHRTIHLRSE